MRCAGSTSRAAHDEGSRQCAGCARVVFQIPGALSKFLHTTLRETSCLYCSDEVAGIRTVTRWHLQLYCWSAASCGTSPPSLPANVFRSVQTCVQCLARVVCWVDRDPSTMHKRALPTINNQGRRTRASLLLSGCALGSSPLGYFSRVVGRCFVAAESVTSTQRFYLHSNLRHGLRPHNFLRHPCKVRMSGMTTTKKSKLTTVLPTNQQFKMHGRRSTAKTRTTKLDVAL